MTRRLLALTLVGFGFLAGVALAQERIDLTAPIAKTSTSNCALDRLELDPDLAVFANSRIVVTLTCNNGDVVTKQYDQFSTPTGAALLSSLNTSNNSAGTSLIKRVYNRLTADGIITGTVSGTPQ